MEGKRDYSRKGTQDFPVGANYAKRDTDYHRTNRYHPDLEIHLLYEGNGFLEIDGKTILMESGCVYFVQPNEVHSMHLIGKTRMRTLIISKDAVSMREGHFFQKELVEPLWGGRLRLPQVLTPEHPAYSTVKDQLDRMNRFNIFSPHYKAGRMGIIMSILTTLIPYCTHDADVISIQETPNDTVRRCLLYLHNFYKKRLTLAEIANHLNINPNYLCTIFREHTGQSVFTHLTHVRIEHGARLLQTTDLPVSEVAALSGFHSECLFYRKFKELMGTTPIAYRKSTSPTTKQTETK